MSSVTPLLTYRRDDVGDLLGVLVVVQVAGEVERGPPVQLVPDADVDPAVDQMLDLMDPQQQREVDEVASS